MAQEQEFEAFSGNDVTLSVTVLDTDTGDALDLTGAQELIWALAKNAQATAILTKTLLDGVTITDAPLGLVDVVLEADDLEPLRGIYYHEMRLTNAAGRKTTLLFGAVTINGNLIKD